MPEKRRGNRPSHFPLTIDPLGGVSLVSSDKAGKGVDFNFQGTDNLSLSRETDGPDWRVISGVGKGTIDILAQKDTLSVNCLMPFMTLKYSRASGILREIVISGVDVAALAGVRVALEKGDWDEVTNQKLLDQDRLIKLTFVPEDEVVELKLISVSGKEVVGAKAIGTEKGDEKSGLVVDWNSFSWRGSLDLFSGVVGLEVFSGEIVLFYEKGGSDETVRQDVVKLPRVVLGMPGFDWKVTRGMPSEDDLLQFMEEVYLPRL